jgi:uncharacterized hydrophobic protein (TIGR00271 family)
MHEDPAPADEVPALYLIHDSSMDADQKAALGAVATVTFLPWAERKTPPRQTRVLFYLGDEMIRELAATALEREWEIGILPHPDARQAMLAMGVRGELNDVFRHYLGAAAIETNAITCNGELVFSSVVIGRVLGLRPYDINQHPSSWHLLKGSLKGLGSLQPGLYKLITAKDKEISLAALGLVVVSRAESALLGRSFVEEFGPGDGRIALLVLAPRSIASYLWFMARLLWPRKIKLSQLPTSLGLVQADRLRIVAPQGVEYLLDGKPVHTSEIEFRLLEDRVHLLPGPAREPARDMPRTVSREMVRLNQVPQGESAQALLHRKLPLFRHASEEEYRELFVALRDDARASPSFQVLMVLSVLIALAGLYSNSAPVIIGAMILAPLMSPIVSLAMGLARSDPGMIRTALGTLLVGVAWGLACGILMAWAMPLDIPTHEMTLRMAPNLLDLMVAVVSGVACAYANAKKEIAKSLAGVAIAVALVPPLSVVGIGIGWADWAMAAGAALLLVTNLVGIALAASVTFWALGFSPFRRARAGLGISLLILAIITVPLSLSFAHLVERVQILEKLPKGTMQFEDYSVQVDHADVTLGAPPLVTLVLASRESLGTAQVDEIKAHIVEKLGQPIQLEVQSNIRR